MLILDIIFDYVLFLSKKEIYKERKFSFLSYQNLRFWGKMIRAELAQLIILDKNEIHSLLFGISKKFHEERRSLEKKSTAFRYITIKCLHFIENVSFSPSISKKLEKSLDFEKKCLHFVK